MPDKGEMIINSLFNYLNLEIQSNCNRSCWFCPRTYDTSSKYLDKDGKSVIKLILTDIMLDIYSRRIERLKRPLLRDYYYV